MEGWVAVIHETEKEEEKRGNSNTSTSPIIQQDENHRRATTLTTHISSGIFPRRPRRTLLSFTTQDDMQIDIILIIFISIALPVGCFCIFPRAWNSFHFCCDTIWHALSSHCSLHFAASRHRYPLAHFPLLSGRCRFMYP